MTVPPYAIADHINYDGKSVYFPGTYESGPDQGVGDYGFFPPFCDNYYYIMMVGAYIKQSGDTKILSEKVNKITVAESLKFAFDGYNIDPDTDLCVSDSEKYTVDWGFADSIKKTGKLLMASLLRYNAAKTLQEIFRLSGAGYYKEKADKIKNNLISVFYDDTTGWFYSATGIGKQYDVWATAYAVFSQVNKNEKTLKVLYDAYKNKKAVADGYVRHILTDNDFSSDTAWQFSHTPYNTYQNGAYWSG